MRQQFTFYFMGREGGGGGRVRGGGGKRYTWSNLVRSDARYFVRVAPGTHQRQMQRGALKIIDLGLEKP